MIQVGETQATIDTGDYVRHCPSDESWVVAYVQGDRVAWCGWPQGEAKLSDCTLLEKATPERRLLRLAEITKMPGDDPRKRYAVARLRQMKDALPLVTRLIQTCEACPSQWEGRTATGDHVYIRYRWGTLQVGLADDREAAVRERIDVGFFGDALDGYLDEDEMRTALAFMLRFAEGGEHDAG